jgi:signal transduction histidine kinase
MDSAGKPGLRTLPAWEPRWRWSALAPTTVNSFLGRILDPIPALLSLGSAALLALSPEAVQAQAELARRTSPPAVPALITNLHQLGQLTRDQARQSPPVNLRAVVTSFDSQWNALFVEDGEGACYISVTNPQPRFNAGEMLAIEGRAQPGLTPQIAFERLTVVSNVPLPAARLISLDDLISTRNDCHRVEIHSAIRSMRAEYQRLILEFGETGGRFEAHLPNYTNSFLPTNLLDARVTITGVVGANFNRQAQLIGVRVYLTSLDDVHVIESAPMDSFDLPAITIKTVSLASPAAVNRIKIGGTVTVATPSGRLYVQDETGGILVKLFPPQPRIDKNGIYLSAPDPLAFRPGDEVEVVGYPALGEYAPLLTDAFVRKTGTAPVPAAAEITSVEALTGNHDARRVSIRARLLARAPRRLNGIDFEVLTMQDGSTLFEAALLPDAKASAFKPGSLLRVTGVCDVQADESRLPNAFRLTVPAAGGIELLEAPPLFGLAHAIGGASVVAVVALVWIRQLRRQVERQQRKVVERERAASEVRELNTTLERRVASRTSELAEANVQLRQAKDDLVKALAQERELTRLKSSFVSMVSHEFRTPLGITMSAVELLRNYLDQLTPGKLKELLDDIHASTLRMAGLMEQVLLLGRVEAGKINFKATPMDVAAFGRKLVDETIAATGRKCPVKFGADGDLAGAQGDESLLRHIFSNLLSNAVKYSPAGSVVECIARREGNDAVFTVRDHGIGIPEEDRARLFEAFHRASNVGETPGTGLGLLIVKRCVELHRGTIDFDSRLREGTTFILRLPLFAG